jgi:hypothetical protein
MEETAIQVQDTTPLVAEDYPDHMGPDRRPEVRRWKIDVYETEEGMRTEVITGRLLGFSSGRADDHTDHAGEWAPEKWKCPACRWVDVSIYDISQDPAARKRYKGGIYLVHTVGRSDLPTEKDFVRIAGARNEFLAVEMLYTRQRGNTYLSVPSSQALAEAAAYDEPLKNVWTRIKQQGTTLGQHG